jgi:hypothetical protein
MRALKAVQVGDMVSRSGSISGPGVVVQKNPDGSVVVDTEPLSVSHYHRYTNTSGLSEAEKNQFNEILDQIYQKTNDIERLNDIQTEIDKLRCAPGSQNIVKYLRNQQAFLMRDTKGASRAYITDTSIAKG